MVMPEGIAQIEKAMRRFDIPSLFEGTLSVCRSVKRTVLHQHILASIKSTLHVKSLIFKYFHLDFLHFNLIYFFRFLYIA